MAIKKYTIEYDNWECVIQFNTEKFTEALLNECLNFFVWQYDKKGDLYAEYAKKLAKQVLHLSMDYNKQGIINNFDEEGFPSLKGKDGVKLVSCDTWTFEDDFFTLINAE